MKVRDVSKKEFMSVKLCRTWYWFTNIYSLLVLDGFF